MSIIGLFYALNVTPSECERASESDRHCIRAVPPFLEEGLSSDIYLFFGFCFLILIEV